jgi:hypothetical protein
MAQQIHRRQFVRLPREERAPRARRVGKQWTGGINGNINGDINEDIKGGSDRSVNLQSRHSYAVAFFLLLFGHGLPRRHFRLGWMG